MIVSVIIPTFGKPVFLEDSIKSVLSQTYKDFELIIVDDNDPLSPERDMTSSIVNKFIDERIIYVKHSHNMNGSVARNTGLSRAGGKYISFLDSDDLYYPSRIAECVSILENSSDDVAGVYTGCEFKKNGTTYNVYSDVKSGNFLVETLATSFMFCSGSNLFVKRSVIDELKGFDISFSRHQDYEFLVRLFEKYNLTAINRVLLVKNNENFNLPCVEKMIEIKKQYLKKYSYILNKMPTKDLNYIYSFNCYSIAELALRTNRKALSKEYYKKGKAYRRLGFKGYLRKVYFSLFNSFKKDSI